MSRVIKGDNLVFGAYPPNLQRPGKAVAATAEGAERILAAARTKAQRILDDAQVKADSIIEEALRGAGKLVEEAKNEGRRMGWDEGIARAREEAESILGDAESLRERARHEAEQMHMQSQRDIVRLAVSIAEKILRCQVEVDPASVAPMISGALQRVRGAGRAVVRVAPEMVEAVEANRDQIPASDLGIRDLKVEADPTLEPGDAVIQTEIGAVDARLRRQVQRVTESLRPVIGDE